MFKRITNKDDFIEEPILEMNDDEISNSKVDIINLFGKDYKMYADEWKHHVHIKCTDLCDAKCEFCIEKKERNNPQNKDCVLTSTINLLTQLREQGQLYTVSITGGEPTTFSYIESLVSYINSLGVKLFSINTNGRYLSKIPNDFCGWVDLSKHSIDDSDVFQRDFVLTKENIEEFKKSHEHANVRFQCVLGVSQKMNSLSDIMKFIVEYMDVVDDFSFRNLIIDGDETHISGILLDLRNFLLKHGDFIEQVIQDYYVYETFKLFGKDVTLSWSNMAKLRVYNETHKESNFLEEIIVHPDGTISGSWNKKTLIIYEPQHTNDYYIPCLGIGCNNHCKRFLNSENEEHDNFMKNILKQLDNLDSVVADETIVGYYQGHEGGRQAIHFVDICGSYVDNCR